MAPIAGRRHPFAPALLASSAAMATEAPLYDLTLLLDTEMESERRDQILANVEHAIEGTGEIVGRHEWGVRPTAYEVRKHTDADYHLIQFRGPRDAARAAGPQPEDHGRHPAPPDHQAPPGHARPAGPQRRRHRRPRPPASPEA